MGFPPLFGMFDNNLKCPSCGGEYLHHYRVVAYVREEEDQPTASVTFDFNDQKILQWEKKSLDNPSERRNGVGIVFSCESCPAISELTLAQHKGFSYLAWRIVGEKIT